MKITPEENDLLLQLVKECMIPDIDLHKHVTPQMLADALGISSKAAREKLEARIKSGELGKEKVKTITGKWAYGYFNTEVK